MLTNRRKDILTALALIAPFVVIYAVVFVYPTVKMFLLSFTDAPLIGPGKSVGIANYTRLPGDPRFRTALWNTGYFVLMTVIPGHADRDADLAGRLAAEGPAAVGGAGDVLPALHPAGLGGLSALGLDAELPVRDRHAPARRSWASPGCRS